MFQIRRERPYIGSCTCQPTWCIITDQHTLESFDIPWKMDIYLYNNTIARSIVLLYKYTRTYCRLQKRLILQIRLERPNVGSYICSLARCTISKTQVRHTFEYTASRKEIDVKESKKREKWLPEHYRKMKTSKKLNKK